MHSDIYLDNLDIQETGNNTKALNPSELIKYLLICEHVYAQGSAPLKRNDVIRFAAQYRRCLNVGNNGMKPALSFVLSNSYRSYSSYIDSRLNILHKVRPNVLKYNPEYAAYMRNNALCTAKELDRIIPKAARVQRGKSVDKIFREDMEEMFVNRDGLASRLFLTDRKIDEICYYINNTELFQTYEFEKFLKSICKTTQSWPATTHQLRHTYHMANSLACDARLPSDSIHLLQDNMNAFFDAIGLRQQFIHIKNGTQIENIRTNKNYRKLLDVYLRLDPTKSQSIEKLLIRAKVDSCIKHVLLFTAPAITTFVLTPELKLTTEALCKGIATIVTPMAITDFIIKVVEALVTEAKESYSSQKALKVSKWKSEFQKELPELMAASTALHL